jgi:hypothetical protein
MEKVINELELETQIQEHELTPMDGIRPELIPQVEQWCINKTAEQVDRLLAALSKKNN